MIPFWQNNNGTMKDATKWKRPGAWFDKQKAADKVEFIQTSCRQWEGEYEGQPLILQTWQREVVRGVFGWLRLSDNLRLFREVYIEVPKKNGKSTLGAAFGICILYTDGEPGAQIYSAAAETEQAGIIFRHAKRMVEQDEVLLSVSEIFRRSITYKNSSYVVLSADADSKEGRNSHAVLFDELHVQRNRELYENLKTGMAARRQPLMIMFTTAGWDRNSICWEVHDYAQRIINGTVIDPAFLPVIYAASEDDDWTSEKVWKRANPNYGISVKPDYLRAACERAKAMPGEQNTFKRKHLNMWTQQDKCWLDIRRWDGCGDLPFDREALKGQICYAGLDLSLNNDMSALVLVFPPPRIAMKQIEEEINGKIEKTWTLDETASEPFKVLPFFWIPEEKIVENSKKHRVPYDVWVKQGLIGATENDTINYKTILVQVGKACVEFKLKALVFDPRFSHGIEFDLQADLEFDTDEEHAKRFGHRWLKKFTQQHNWFNAPSHEFGRLVNQKKIAHGKNPVLRWMASGLKMNKLKTNEFIMPDKVSSNSKIDGITALIMALDLAIRNANQNQNQVYLWGLND